MPTNAAILVADRSGSMKSILANTVIGLNAYLEEARKTPELAFTMLRFDTISTDIVYRRTAMAEVPDLTAADIEPRGGTPLIDAICIAIGTAQQEYKDDDRVVFVIMTDGQENASREFTLSQLHDMIKERTRVGWQFIFLGASIDAYADAGKFGILKGSTMSYDSSSVAANQRAYRGVAGQSMSYYETGKPVTFSEQEKQAVGDKFTPGTGGGGPVRAKGGEGTGGAPAKTSSGGEDGGAAQKSLIDRPKL